MSKTKATERTFRWSGGNGELFVTRPFSVIVRVEPDCINVTNGTGTYSAEEARALALLLTDAASALEAREAAKE